MFVWKLCLVFILVLPLKVILVRKLAVHVAIFKPEIKKLIAILLDVRLVVKRIFEHYSSFRKSKIK